MISGGFSPGFGWRSAGVPITPGFGAMGWRGSPLRSSMAEHEREGHDFSRAAKWFW
jgi:hypothetical protein